jgi:hypothetical protein
MEGPSKALLSVEGIRAICEYGMGWLLNVPLQSISPAGDGHPILVFPGLGTADGSTHYVRNFLTELGYDAQPWGMGRNLGPRQGMEKLMEQLVRKLEDVSMASGGQQVSLVGWSLGGIYGRELAKLMPDSVRQVITLGTPFKSGGVGTNAGFLYELLSKDTSHKNPEIIKQIEMAPPVPFTSLYSKTDGVVHWECSIEDEGPLTQNIEIPGASHLGLGHNPISMYILANRLAQEKKTWAHYSK